MINDMYTGNDSHLTKSIADMTTAIIAAAASNRVTATMAATGSPLLSVSNNRNIILLTCHCQIKIMS